MFTHTHTHRVKGEGIYSILYGLHKYIIIETFFWFLKDKFQSGVRPAGGALLRSQVQENVAATPT